ncbi:MAG: InlB B-repeat-containing protein [Tannerella sp.]|jgi:rhamnogalacturonan endolyase|nr:InlB B-repeat-containing protein [Tannerella sp.]
MKTHDFFKKRVSGNADRSGLCQSLVARRSRRLSFFLITLILIAVSNIASVYSQTTWDVTTDFESGLGPFSTPVAGGGTTTNRSSQTLGGETGYVLYFTGSGNGGRMGTFPLTNAIQGRELKLKFDWYAGTVTTATCSGYLYLLDNVSSAGNTIFAINYGSGVSGSFRYQAGTEGAIGGGITNFNRWYTLEFTINYQTSTCDFTITDKNTPANTSTINGIPLDPAIAFDATFRRIRLGGNRASGQALTLTAAIDNYSHKVVDASLPSIDVTSVTVDGLNRVDVGDQILMYPRVLPENASDRSVNWTSSAPGVASVSVDTNNRPIVTGVSAGTAVIKATSVSNGSVYGEKTITVGPLNLPERPKEKLDRGLVAVATGGNVFLSWRLLDGDPADIGFNLYKNNAVAPLNGGSPLGAAYTDYTDAGGTTTDVYSLGVTKGGVELYRTQPAQVWNNQYLSIPVQKPAGYLPDGTPYTDYTIYDGSVGDLDGDGQYEIVFVWAPANLQDNSTGDATGNMYIDAYKLDGTKLWGAGKWIDLGRNIRAGAHYLQLLVYDFDGDGKAEIVTRTSDWSIDTEGTIIGAEVNHMVGGRDLTTGEHENVSVFDGPTGRVLDSKAYNPPRGDVNGWGDNYGNRSDRFLAGVAFLDGVRPSAVMCRGYYTRTTLCAWDWDGEALSQRWLFDSNTAGSQYKGQGNHNLSVADVDNDGKDEIIYGSLTIDDDGSAMYTIGLGHGDAMHVGKLDPSRPGLQYFGVHEEAPFGLHMHDLLTGDIIWRVTGSSDTGRGVSADVDPDYEGNEAWSSGGLGTYSATGTRLGGSISSMNMVIYWDGDTGRELFDGQSNPSVTKINPSGTPPNRDFSSSSTLITFSGASTNGGTKANPCLQADILGDWREEVILRKSDNTELRIYTTVAPTSHSGPGTVPSTGIPTLMHNKEYRLAIAWQNSAYNQPPHTDYFIGYNMSNVVERSENSVAIEISLDPNGGTFTDDASTNGRVIKVLSRDYVALPEVSVPGVNFRGWYFADNTTPYDPSVIYDGNIELKALWEGYKVTFAGPGVTTLIMQVVGSGDHATKPSDPVRAGYVFAGWYNGATLWNFDNDVVTQDVTLTAGWIDLYTVTFAGDGVTTFKQNVLSGSHATEPSDPVRAGYRFTGWYNGATLWDFDNGVVTQNVTLAAGWVPVYTVTFIITDSDNRQLYDGMTIIFDGNTIISSFGRYTITNLLAGVYEYTILKDGYFPVTDRIVVSGSNIARRVAMYSNMVTPEILREIVLPQIGDFVIDPSPGAYYVLSGKDFVFTLTSPSLRPAPTLVTGRIIQGQTEFLTGAPNADGGYTYTIRQVRQRIEIRALDDENIGVDNEGIQETQRVWSYGGKLHIRMDKTAVLSIYTAGGMLYKRQQLNAGDTVIPLNPGFYIVAIGDKYWKIVN